MNHISTVLKYIRSFLIYIPGLVSFLVLAITVIIISLTVGSQKYDSFIKLLCRIFVNVFFIKVNVEGIEKIDPQKTYIFTCNHVNFFDLFILNGYIPNITRGVELDSHFNYPIWGAVIKKFGNIPISHRNPKSALVSLNKAKEALKNGISIIILPEGHRTRDGKLLPFMKGPFYLAKHAHADVFPTAIIGAYKINKAKNLIINPGTITFKIGDVIPYKSYEDLHTNQLRDLVKQHIQTLIGDSPK